MATNTCNNCGCKKCGCSDTGLVSPAPCPTSLGCPTPQPCSEVINAQCVVYTGDPIMCGLDEVVPTDTNVATALNDVVTYFCDNQTRSLRFVKEFTSINFNATFVTITRAELTACGINPSLCSEDGSEFSDFVVNIWYITPVATAWRFLPPYTVGGSWAVAVDSITGDITFLLNSTVPLDPPATVRIVIMF